MKNIADTGIKPIVIDELCALAKRHGIKTVILFGSRARGDYMAKSDIDLAVSGGDAVKFQLDAEDETSTLLSFDVVDINGAGEKLVNAVNTEGVTLYEKV